MKPEELEEAVTVAEKELHRFSKQIATILTRWEFHGDVADISLKLAGLKSE